MEANQGGLMRFWTFIFLIVGLHIALTGCETFQTAARRDFIQADDWVTFRVDSIHAVYRNSYVGNIATSYPCIQVGDDESKCTMIHGTYDQFLQKLEGYQ